MNTGKKGEVRSPVESLSRLGAFSGGLNSGGGSGGGGAAAGGELG